MGIVFGDLISFITTDDSSYSLVWTWLQTHNKNDRNKKFLEREKNNTEAILI